MFDMERPVIYCPYCGGHPEKGKGSCPWYCSECELEFELMVYDKEEAT